MNFKRGNSLTITSISSITENHRETDREAWTVESKPNQLPLTQIVTFEKQYYYLKLAKIRGIV